MLDISKIEAGQLQVAQSHFNVRASIAKIASMVQPMAEKKGLILHAKIAPEVDRIISDPRRVEQILLNLLNNAIKFTDKGEVTLRAEIISASNPGAIPVLRISVSDTGMGIKPEDLATLFQPFRKWIAAWPASTKAPDWAWPSAVGWPNY